MFASENFPDAAFLSLLSSAGIFDAATKIGLDANKYLVPLANSTHHSYRRYRWSVGYHKNGGLLINAFPPEEESGWTPWERWFQDNDGVTQKDSWVLFPLKNTTPGGKPDWYKLEDDDLMPFFLRKKSGMENILRRARIFDAAVMIGFDAVKTLLEPLSETGRDYYHRPAA